MLTSWLYYYCYSPIKIEEDYLKRCKTPERITVCCFYTAPHFQVLTYIIKQKVRDNTTGIYILYINSPVSLYHSAKLKPPTFFCKYTLRYQFIPQVFQILTYLETGIAKMKFLSFSLVMDHTDVDGITSHFVWHF